MTLAAPPMYPALFPTRLKFLLAFGLLVGWEVLPRLGVIPQLFLPSLSQTLAALLGSASEYGVQLLHEGLRGAACWSVYVPAKAAAARANRADGGRPGRSTQN